MPINEENGSRWRSPPNRLIGQTISACSNHRGEWHLYNEHGKRMLIIKHDGACYDGDGMMFVETYEFLGAG